MTAAGLRYEGYGASREWMMRIGPDAPAILLIPPLFEEMNRTRAFMAAVMRRLAETGLGSILPDLPGTGESARALAQVQWDTWRQAVGELAGLAVATVAIRGGCLLDDAAALPGWRLAPVEGSSLVRDLERSGMVSGGGAAGYDPSPSLIDALRGARPTAKPVLRTIRLGSDRGEADLKVEGPPLWRRSEPQTSAQLCSLVADDIQDWARACAGC